MQRLEFRAPFGNFKPGDVIDVEDGAVYDTLYLVPAPEAPDPKPRKPAEKPGRGAPLYPKKGE